MVKVKNNLIGQRFGKLVVVKQVEDYISPNGWHGAKWLCKCDCGNEVEKQDISLKRGCNSCGCITYERIRNGNRKTNKYDLSGKYGIGFTSNGQQFYFDIDDYEKIKDYSWHKSSDGYIVAHSHEDSSKIIRIHRLILDTNEFIDHINHNKSDNRKCNLRVASYIQNSQNRSIQNNNTTNVTGVYWNKKNKKWVVIIVVNKRRMYLGSYANKDEAIEVRQNAEKKYFGEFRRNG